MKCKVFTGSHWYIAEKHADHWLATRTPQFELHHSETCMRGLPTVKVWYELGRGRPHQPARGHLARASAKAAS